LGGIGGTPGGAPIGSDQAGRAPKGKLLSFLRIQAGFSKTWPFFTICKLFMDKRLQDLKDSVPKKWPQK